MIKVKKGDFKKRAELPYNPEDVNIRLQHFIASELLDMIESEDSDIKDSLEIWEEDDLQRNKDLWNKVQKSLFIESLMIKLPIPLFYLDGSQKPWRVIDGLQRLHTMLTYINGEYKLMGLEYLGEECNGKFFKELPGYLKSRVLNAELEAYVINPGTPPEVKYNIFKRINTGGLKLTGQEVRNAFCRGVPANFIKKLSQQEVFKKVTNYKVPSRRMEDREFVNRFIAFQIYDYNEYNSKMDLFLTEAMMELYIRQPDELDELKMAFMLTCKRTYDLFGEMAFYRLKDNLEYGRKPTKAMFDTLTWNINLLSNKEFSKISDNLKTFKKEYKKFIVENYLFYRAVADTTGSKSAVQNRFNELYYFFKNYLQ